MICDNRAGPYVVAVNTRDGTLVWKTSRSNPVEGYSTPAIYTPAEGRPQLLVFGSGALDAYDTDNGKRLRWVNRVGLQPKGVPCGEGEHGVCQRPRVR